MRVVVHDERIYCYADSTRVENEEKDVFFTLTVWWFALVDCVCVYLWFVKVLLLKKSVRIMLQRKDRILTWSRDLCLISSSLWQDGVYQTRVLPGIFPSPRRGVFLPFFSVFHGELILPRVSTTLPRHCCCRWTCLVWKELHSRVFYVLFHLHFHFVPRVNGGVIIVLFNNGHRNRFKPWN